MPAGREQLKATIMINDTEEAVKIYSNLYDNLLSNLPNCRSNVYYQKDIQILERYGDIEAEKYYKQEKEQKSERQHHGKFIS